MRLTQADARLLLVDLNSLHEQNQHCTIWYDTDDDMYHIKRRLDVHGTVTEVVCKYCHGKGKIKMDKLSNHPDEICIFDKCATCDGTGRM